MDESSCAGAGDVFGCADGSGLEDAGADVGGTAGGCVAGPRLSVGRSLCGDWPDGDCANMRARASPERTGLAATIPGVGEGLGTEIGVGVAVGASTGEGVGVGVDVGVGVGLNIGVGVAKGVASFVGVGVGFARDPGTGVIVGVGVGVAVCASANPLPIARMKTKITVRIRINHKSLIRKSIVVNGSYTNLNPKRLTRADLPPLSSSCLGDLHAFRQPIFTAGNYLITM